MDRIIKKIRHSFPPRTAVCKMRGGYRIILRPSLDEYELRMYVDREYEPATLSLFDKILRPGDTMVDIGANLGLMTIHAANRVGNRGRVIAIEPHPKYYERLVANVQMNGLKNVHTSQIAAGSTVDRKIIYDVPAVNIGRSSLINPGVGSCAAGEVAVDTLDNILSQTKTQNVRLLKIDVEGFEFQVLRGAPDTLQKRPIICMEFEPSLPTEGWDHFSSHDLILGTGGYNCYRFSLTKFISSPLVEIRDKQEMLSLSYDNLIYVPSSLKNSLPPALFLD